ncbi:MAG: heavy-metal-associated domain-containing protein [Butyricicoccaceae bacterium]
MHCVAHVKKALEELPGVTAEVDLDERQGSRQGGAASGRCQR